MESYNLDQVSVFLFFFFMSMIAVIGLVIETGVKIMTWWQARRHYRPRACRIHMIDQKSRLAKRL